MININNVLGEVRINEIEPNPDGDDSNNEWVELYYENQINLTGWKIVNNDNETINLSGSFQNYLIINLSGLWLDNTNEKVFLYNGSNLVDETSIVDDDRNYQSWSYCNNSWGFRNPTPGTSNNCSSSTNFSTPPPSTTTPELSLDMNWNEDEIINGLEEFEIDVIAKNLDDEETYDIKVWIKFEDNETIISQTYDENDTWISSNDYYNLFFENEINKTKSITLRIKDNYKTYHGDAIIKIRIRETGSSYIQDLEISKDIIILEKDEDNSTTEQTEEIDETLKEIVTTNNSQIKTIKLGSSLEVFNNSIKENKSPIIYESSNEKIKRYAVFGFAGLCLIITILALFNKLN